MHTPTPWKQVKCGIYFDCNGQRLDVPVLVAATGDDEYKGIESEAQIADAALIVKAVNTHARLVAHIQRLTNELDRYLHRERENNAPDKAVELYVDEARTLLTELDHD